MIISAKWQVLLLALLISTLVSKVARANTYTAASCNESDVAASVALTSNGDTVNVPTCPSPTWATMLTITKGITLNFEGGTPNSGTGTVGSGANGSTILSNGGTSNPIIEFQLSQGQTGILQNVNIEPLTSSTQLMSPIWLAGTCTSSGCPDIRIDNVSFTGWSESGNGNQAEWLIRSNNFFGVIDHTTTDGGGANIALLNISHSAYLGIGGYGDNSFYIADSYGTANALYVENDLFANGAYVCDSDAGGTGTGGGRIAVRYNTFTSETTIPVYFHGTESTGRPRGGRQAEVYDNTITCTNNTGGCQGILVLRSGVGVIFGNSVTVSGGAWLNSFVGLADYRRLFAGFAPWGGCNGNGSWDQNDGVTYHSGTHTGSSGASVLTDLSTSSGTLTDQGDPYAVIDVTHGWSSEISANTSTTITDLGSGGFGAETWTNGDSYQVKRASLCIDQPGRDQGTLLSGSTPTPTGWVNEVLDPIYEFDDSINSSLGFGNVSSSTASLIANRDFYMESTNQAAQTSPTSPFNGTSGTGHGTLANRPTTCTPAVGYWATDTSTLYVCLTANTWTAHYTPYAYPHPLIGDPSGPQSGGPPAPTGVEATLSQ